MQEKIDEEGYYKMFRIWAKLEKEPEKLTEEEKKIVREYGVDI